MDLDALLHELYRLERFGIKLGLDNVRELLRRVGNPEAGLEVVHITGSNGKGSVSAFLASVLRAAGHRTGWFTSPHLVRFNERIRVDGEPIPDGDIARLYAELKPHVESMAGPDGVHQPTFFEVTTAMAFRYFRERAVDVAVVEVGMGGRMDATNVVTPEVAVVTRIGLEHTEHLGRTVERIAAEKSGIIKPGCHVVTLEQPTLRIIEAKARRLGCPLRVVGRDLRASSVASDPTGQVVRVEDGGTVELRIPLAGPCQVENAALAFATVESLRERDWDLPDDAVKQGFASAYWPARLQVVRESPRVIVDATHNALGAAALAGSLRELYPGRTFHFVLGILDDKDVAGMAEALGPLAAGLVACRPDTKRAFDPDAIREAFAPWCNPSEAVADTGEALRHAVEAASPGDIVIVTGSIYTAGEALASLGIRP